MTNETGEKVFELSLLADTLPILVLSGSGFAGGIVSLATVPTLYVSAAGSILIATLALAAFIRINTSELVRSAKFYDEFFRIDKRGWSGEIRYQDIKNASLSTPSGLSAVFGPRVVIRLTEQDKVLTLNHNATSRKLKADLYSWLTKKIAE